MLAPLAPQDARFGGGAANVEQPSPTEMGACEVPSWDSPVPRRAVRAAGG